MLDLFKSIFGWVFELIFDSLISNCWRVFSLTIVGGIIGFALLVYTGIDMLFYIGIGSGLLLGLLWQKLD